LSIPTRPDDSPDDSPLTTVKLSG